MNIFLKPCSKCQQLLSCICFTKDKNRKDGKKPYCKNCCALLAPGYNPERQKQYRTIHRNKLNLQSSQYYEKHRNKRLASARHRKQLNPNRDKEQYQRHRDKVIIRARIRKGVQKQAQPKWLTPEQLAEIAKIYLEAKRLGWHVDHIVPLQGKTVCGLHVPWNLRPLSPLENWTKTNRMDVHR